MSSIEERAAAVEAIVFDVDGVLTGGEIIYGPGGEWKVFNVQDGHGFKLARRAGLKIGLLSGRESDAVRTRAEDVGVDVLIQGSKDKRVAIEDMLEQLKVEAGRMCYVGDDVVDLPAMRRAGFPVAVPNAVAEVRAAASWTTSRKGGEGAARDVIEMVLRSKGLWEKVMERYMREPDDDA